MSSSWDGTWSIQTDWHILTGSCYRINKDEDGKCWVVEVKHWTAYWAFNSSRLRYVLRMSPCRLPWRVLLAEAGLELRVVNLWHGREIWSSWLLDYAVGFRKTTWMGVHVTHLIYGWKHKAIWQNVDEWWWWMSTSVTLTYSFNCFCLFSTFTNVPIWLELLGAATKTIATLCKVNGCLNWYEPCPVGQASVLRWFRCLAVNNTFP